MRREYIEYFKDLPIKIYYEDIEEYPMHWHDSLEIVYVLKGHVDITIETETERVYEGEVEIINCDEAHRFFNGSKENRILRILINADFFARYYDVDNILFYTDTTGGEAQKSEKYEELRRYLAILLCEAAQKGDDYEDIIEDEILELLYYLLNNFHYLIYDEESLKENEVQFERYNRIIKYIYSNYSNKISLQDIAEREYLSSHYLSHEIKNNVGYNFKDFLNLTRVEEAIKLLLDSDKTLTEISEELGFSHTRYFNKHFKKHTGLTPMQYRKKFKISENKYESTKKVKELNINEALKEVSEYLEDYDRFNYEDKIFKVNVDLTKEYSAFNRRFQEVINVGQGTELLKEKQRSFVEEIQNDIEFKYVLVSKLLSKEMNVYIDEEENDFFYWEEVREVIEFLKGLKLRPIVVIDRTLKNMELLKKMLDSFTEYFYEDFGEYEVGKWMFAITEDYPDEKEDELKTLLFEEYGFEVFQEDYIFTSVSRIYDTAYMVPYIIYQHLNKDKYLSFITAFDEMHGRENINNEQFFGGSGLINKQGIKKPSYYAYYFLSRLGNNIVGYGDGYVITEDDEDIQILLYSYSDEFDRIISYDELYKKRGLKNTTERKFSINIEGLSYDYKVTKYEINEKTGSSFNYWISLGKPKRLDEDERDLLTKISLPHISLAYAKKSPVYNIFAKVKGYGAVFISLQKIK